MQISLPALLTTLAALGFGMDLFTHLLPQGSERDNMWNSQVVSYHQSQQRMPPPQFASAFSPSLARSDEHMAPRRSRVR